jgi:hypothetical protein
VVTNIITSILTENGNNLELDLCGIGDPILREKSSFADGDGNNTPTVDKGEFPNVGDGQVDVNTSRSIDAVQGSVTRISTTYQDYGAYVVNDTAMLVNGSAIGNVSWRSLMDVHPGTYQAGISQIRLKTIENGLYVIGSITINSTDETKLDITWDTDTIPSNTALTGFDGNERTTIDFIIDPLRWNPQDRLVPGLRLLLLDNIGDVVNANGATAWKNTNNTDFVADEGDIVEWSGSEWSIIFDASNATDPIYTRNLNTGIQYKWTTEGWIKSFEGEYSGGTWMLYLDS